MWFFSKFLYAVSRLLQLKPYRRIELNVNSIRPIESIIPSSSSSTSVAQTNQCSPEVIAYTATTAVLYCAMTQPYRTVQRLYAAVSQTEMPSIQSTVATTETLQLHCAVCPAANYY